MVMCVDFGGSLVCVCFARWGVISWASASHPKHLKWLFVLLLVCSSSLHVFVFALVFFFSSTLTYSYVSIMCIYIYIYILSFLCDKPSFKGQEKQQQQQLTSP